MTAPSASTTVRAAILGDEEPLAALNRAFRRLGFTPDVVRFGLTLPE
jgi:hypothetical protein